ncbi:hypothetical protein [Streptomyces sp. NBC_01538]|uniref:hypothetical protein n=1 Tax=Streptomyces sp. NBC_01538 TaxID=2903897 RepID=UPI00386F65F2
MTGCSPTTARTSVVLPEPEAPTIPVAGAGRDGEGDAVQGRGVRATAEGDPEVADVEHGFQCGRGRLPLGRFLGRTGCGCPPCTGAGVRAEFHHLVRDPLDEFGVVAGERDGEVALGGQV